MPPLNYTGPPTAAHQLEVVDQDADHVRLECTLDHQCGYFLWAVRGRYRGTGPTLVSWDQKP